MFSPPVHFFLQSFSDDIRVSELLHGAFPQTFSDCFDTCSICIKTRHTITCFCYYTFLFLPLVRVLGMKIVVSLSFEEGLVKLKADLLVVGLLGSALAG